MDLLCFKNKLEKSTVVPFKEWDFENYTFSIIVGLNWDVVISISVLIWYNLFLLIFFT